MIRGPDTGIIVDKVNVAVSDRKVQRRARCHDSTENSTSLRVVLLVFLLQQLANGKRLTTLVDARWNWPNGFRFPVEGNGENAKDESHDNGSNRRNEQGNVE
jgi:hypothetical protein